MRKNYFQKYNFEILINFQEKTLQVYDLNKETDHYLNSQIQIEILEYVTNNKEHDIYEWEWFFHDSHGITSQFEEGYFTRLI